MTLRASHGRTSMAEDLVTLPMVPAKSDVTTRVEAITQDADLSWVVSLLTERRDEILMRWLDAATDQPFHQARSEKAVADHIPELFDALVRLLTNYSDPSRSAGVPLEDPDVLAAANSHARVRFQQGFTAPSVAIEFRLLRQEIGRALRAYVSDRSPTTDVIGAELLLHDALDGAVFIALTTLNEHEVARRTAEVALEEERALASSEREAFFTTLGHDLKSPLATAMAIAQLLRHQAAKGRLDVTQIESRLASIEGALRRGALRVDELMDLARRDGPEAATLHREPIDLVALVRAVLEGYRVTNDRHEIVLGPGIDSLVGEWDRDRIERSVDNLVSNAVKFSPHGGRIEATVTEDRSGERRDAVVTITDQGLGIPPADHDAIFARFRRGSNATDLPGSGVGLWSVRRIVEQHGGLLTVDSRLGAGSTFTLRLPIGLSAHD
ncbi:MAG TPA: sensor histidine kinase [Candidatus Saccharimonadales bacterium]|jgi:signal transduction histidine kinase|nr:sensor histidine kinase [Candidatus Saccharimonadales bacterium]